MFSGISVRMLPLAESRTGGAEFSVRFGAILGPRAAVSKVLLQWHKTHFPLQPINIHVIRDGGDHYATIADHETDIHFPTVPGRQFLELGLVEIEMINAASEVEAAGDSRKVVTQAHRRSLCAGYSEDSAVAVVDHRLPRERAD